MANENRNCNQICRWNDSSDGCIKPNGRICPMSNTEPDASGWGQVKVKNEHRLIDANALQEHIGDCYGYPAVDILHEIATFPTVEAEPVVHGHWVKHNFLGHYQFACSECQTLGSPQWKRCPVCEAKMDGGNEDG